MTERRSPPTGGRTRLSVRTTEVPRGTAALLLVLSGCGQAAEEYGPQGTIDFEPERPTLLPMAEAVPYTGTNPYVLEAQRLHRTANNLHRNVIVRTCGPTQGVCHNQKEYPDLHLSSTLLGTVNAPCNVQPGDWSAVYDGCELPGDRFQLGGSREVEIGWVDYIVGEADYGERETPTLTSPGLHIQLQATLDIGDGRTSTWDEGGFIETAVSGGEIVENRYGGYQTEWYLIEDGTHLVGEVHEWQAEGVARLLEEDIEQGDMNRNGVFGARDSSPLNMLRAGDPESSYLIGRLRGELAGQRIPGTRMPLANDPLTIPDMLALFCFVEGLPADLTAVYDMSSPIDYENCSWSSDPEGLNLLGMGATWLGRVQPLLESNCGGCHGGEEPQAGFDVLSEGAYERLLEPSVQVPTMPFVTPGDPSQSYLWLKMTSGEGMLGLGMPLDSAGTVRPLTDGALADIQTWITNGAAAEE